MAPGIDHRFGSVARRIVEREAINGRIDLILVQRRGWLLLLLLLLMMIMIRAQALAAHPRRSKNVIGRIANRDGLLVVE